MSGAVSETVRGFIAEQPVGVLATQRRDGSIRQSLIYHILDGDRVLISTLGKRDKARDVRRTGRASCCVCAHEKPFASVTIEGPVRIISSGISAPTALLLAKITGQTPPSPPTDEMLASIDRVILEITIERAYALSYLPASGS
jgi:PPOX class probable F420-dependent enzyme